MKPLTFTLLFLTALCLLSCTDSNSSPQLTEAPQTPTQEYIFEGIEPFWQMEIHNDSILLFCDNKEVHMRATFAEKNVNGNTIGFSNDEIYGIINENWKHNCCYSISEKDSLPYEIFFVFEGKTYRGCGEKRHSSLLFSDGESATIINKYLDYNNIDSINVSQKSFVATYRHCGKGLFHFQKQDLKFIKDKTLREEIAYYYVIRDGEENLCEEPTAVLLSQGGEEFYLNTLKKVENACSFPENTPVTCQAYWLKIHTPNGIFDVVVIENMKKSQE
ncbi:MAG: hypothetical protein IJP65_03060 [Bacteroidales bacterium]|nr:hypothetical protein [Bacteroidales bacterium]MBR0054268.1 hypothetical protein [Bacteroidales bacterium]